MKKFFGDYDAKVGRDNIFKPTIGNKNLHEISNDNIKKPYCQKHDVSTL
jgi:hypothetical protein